MAIFHFKHGYLNWRAIPCRRKMIYVYVIFNHFFHIFFWIWLSWFLFRLTRIFQDDNHFFFFLFIVLFIFFLVLMVCLFRATMHAINDLPNWSIFSHVRIVLKGWSFGPKLFISFLSKERVMAQKCSREMGNFGQHALRH